MLHFLHMAVVKNKCQELIWWHVDVTHSLLVGFCYLLLLFHQGEWKYKIKRKLATWWGSWSKRMWGKHLLLVVGLFYHLIELNSERGALKGKRDAWKNWFAWPGTKMGMKNFTLTQKDVLAMKKGHFLMHLSSNWILLSQTIDLTSF